MVRRPFPTRLGAVWLPELRFFGRLLPGAAGPDILPRLRSELLEVIKKYVQVNDEAVKVNFEKDKDGIQEVLDIQIALPDKS